SAKRPVVRTKPQVIYHLPPASNYAATLHAQAKGQNNDLPIDNDMPVSLQLSRANANAAAAAAEAREEATPSPSAQPRFNRPRPPSHQSARPRSLKPKGGGNFRPDKRRPH